MLIGRTSLLAISTLTSEINFYTRLIKMKDPSTLEPMFSTFCVELACHDCKEAGKQVDCKVSVVDANHYCQLLTDTDCRGVAYAAPRACVAIVAEAHSTQDDYAGQAGSYSV
jgi:hypothetical protein